MKCPTCASQMEDAPEAHAPDCAWLRYTTGKYFGVPVSLGPMQPVQASPPIQPTPRSSGAYRVAIYTRVSTTDQHCRSQTSECRSHIERQGWTLAAEYSDTGISGAKTKRPELDRCIADAQSRKFDCIVVYKLDRWGRSLIHLSQSIAELQRIGVRFVAISQGIDTDQNNPTAKLVLHILASVAEWERETIRERTRAGVRAAMAQGKLVGRPKRVFRVDMAREMASRGSSWREISLALGVPVTTIRGALKRAI